LGRTGPFTRRHYRLIEHYEVPLDHPGEIASGAGFELLKGEKSRKTDRDRLPDFGVKLVAELGSRHHEENAGDGPTRGSCRQVR
jgi:hypothetical protein